MDEGQEQIPEIPQLPEGIVAAARRGKLVLFVGAGVSMAAGGPSWEELANNLLEQLVSVKALTYSAIDQLKDLDAKKKISIAADIYTDKGLSPNFREALNLDRLKQADIHNILYSLGASIVTTNYDTCFEVLAEKKYPQVNSELQEGEQNGEEKASLGPRSNKVFYHKEQLTIEKLNVQGSILQLHGSVRVPDLMVLTTKDYLGHYSDQTILTFLQELFKNHTVLFIGYGLEEQEILEQIFRIKQEKHSSRHYILLPFFSHANDLYRHLRRYYLNNYGVEVLCYCIDRNGHEQIREVIRSWFERLLGVINEPDFIEKVKIIDEALDE